MSWHPILGNLSLENSKRKEIIKGRLQRPETEKELIKRRPLVPAIEKVNIISSSAGTS